MSRYATLRHGLAGTALGLGLIALLAAHSPCLAQSLGTLTETEKIWGALVGQEMGGSLSARGRRVAAAGANVYFCQWTPANDFTGCGSSANTLSPAPLSVANTEVAWADSSIVSVAPWADGATSPAFSSIESIPVSSVGSVALDGARIAMGLPGSDRVEVWVRNPMGTWVLEKEFLASLPGRNFGAAVDLDGGTLAIGAPGVIVGVTGRVEVWQRHQGNWLSLGSYFAPGNEVANGFGSAVSVSGRWLAVGAPLEDTAFPQTFMIDPGAVYLFEQPLPLGTFEHRVSLFGENDGDRFGSSLNLDDLTLVVGAPLFDVSDFPFDRIDAGRGYLYWRSGDLWSLAATLEATDASSLDNLGASSAVAASGVLVGAPSAKGGASNDVEDAGGVYFYRGLNPFFVDGFESADLSGWTSSVP